MTTSMADILVYTMWRLYTLPTIRVKVQKNIVPNHAVLIRHNTTLPRCDCIGTLQDLYKDSLTCTDPLRFQAAVVITLPNEEDALPGTYVYTIKRTALYPINALPSFSFGKIIIN